MWTVYILKCADGKFYTGQSDFFALTHWLGRYIYRAASFTRAVRTPLSVKREFFWKHRTNYKPFLLGITVFVHIA